MDKKIEKNDFFKKSHVLTPTMIIEKTQLGDVVSLLKGLEGYFYAEDEKSIFYFKNFRALGFYTRKGDEVQLWGAKIDFSSSA